MSDHKVNERLNLKTKFAVFKEHSVTFENTTTKKTNDPKTLILKS